MIFKYDPNDYCDYLKCDLENLYEKYKAYFDNKCSLTCLGVENAYERFFYGLKSCDVKMNHKDIDLFDLKEYCFSLLSNVRGDYETIRFK